MDSATARKLCVGAAALKATPDAHPPPPGLHSRGVKGSAEIAQRDSLLAAASTFFARMAKKKSSAPEASTSDADPVLPGVNPAVAHDDPEHSAPFTICGIGASAGGIDALSRLLRSTP